MNSLLVSFIYTGQCVCFFFCSFLFYFVALHDIFDQKGVWEGEGLTPSLPPHRTHIDRRTDAHLKKPNLASSGFLKHLWLDHAW
jgi:hypothetical protein